MSAQSERDYFWQVFDSYVKQNGSKFYTTHQKEGVNQAAGNINNPSPMATQTICCEYKYLDQVILVQVYINKNVPLFNYLYLKRFDLEEELGYSVEWIKSGKYSSTVRRIQKQFKINKPIKEMVEEVYPYILDFINVFSKYL